MTPRWLVPRPGKHRAGAHDADFPRFDIRKVLERLLLKGQIVVKKSYCDLSATRRLSEGCTKRRFRSSLEIPLVRQSGKNSADIRMVVDALDLCYTKQSTSTPSSLLAAIRTFRRSSANCARTTRLSSASALKVHVRSIHQQLRRINYYDDLVRGSQQRYVERCRDCASSENW